MRPVSISKVSIGTEIDCEQINNELSDLHSGQITLPPDLGSSSGAEVIIVHQHVNGQVEGNRNPRLLKEVNRQAGISNYIAIINKKNNSVNVLYHTHTLFFCNLQLMFYRPIERSKEPLSNYGDNSARILIYKRMVTPTKNNSNQTHQ